MKNNNDISNAHSGQTHKGHFSFSFWRWYRLHVMKSKVRSMLFGVLSLVCALGAFWSLLYSIDADAEILTETCTFFLTFFLSLTWWGWMILQLRILYLTRIIKRRKGKASVGKNPKSGSNSPTWPSHPCMP